MLRNTYVFIWEQNVYIQSVCSIIIEGKEKELKLIKKVKLTQEFEEAHEVACLLKVSPSGRESLSCYFRS